MSLEEERKSLVERKRNVLLLISQYLCDFGLTQTNTVLIKESNILANGYELCDNIDLESIYLDYMSYYQLKFGRLPKIIKKIEQQIDSGITRKSSANVRRKAMQKNSHKIVGTNSEVTKDKCLNETLLNSTLTVLPLTHNLNVQDSQESNDDAVGGIDLYMPIVLPQLSDYEYFTPEWKEMADIVCRDIIRKPYSKINWKCIHGHESVRNVLIESVLLPLQYPELFYDIERPWKCVLLHGPPGTGKTLMARALCNETMGKVTFFNVASSTIISKWRGDSEKFIRILFEVAKFYAPSIIFIDEIDGLSSKRDGSSDHEASKRFKNEFLAQIDGLDADKLNVFLLGSTNLPWEIDPAFLRRFERKMMFGMPDSVTRKCLIEQFLQPFKKWNIQKQNELTALTEGFSGDDIRIACKEVSMKMIRDAINLGIKSGNSHPEKHLKEPTSVDFEKAVKNIQRVSIHLLAKHEIWSKQHGN